MHGTVPPGRPRSGPRRGASGANPTVLDALFIIFAAVTLLLFLLWVLPGGETKYSNAPPFLKDMVNSVWAKLSFAGGSAAALILRRFLEKRPAPNYLIWIPGFMGILIGTLFLLSKMFPPPPPQGSVRSRVSLALDAPSGSLELFHKEGQPDFKLWELLPEEIDAHGVYYNSANPNFPYRDTLNLKQGGRSQAYIKLASKEGDTRGSDKPFDYKICLQAGARLPGESGHTGVVLSCAKGVCSPAKPDDPGYVVGVDCEARSDNAWSTLPTVLAAEQTQPTRERGWNVPSVATLQKMNDLERPGYTLFDVAFTPQGKAAQADKYYFALRINGQPVYIDGLSHGLEKEGLQQGSVNHIVFALENLNFTGEFQGKEKLHLSVYFLAKGTPLFTQELDREYIALRPAESLSFETSVGTFQWSGSYVAPQNQNKFEVLLASSDCGEPPRKDCVDRAVNAKRQFDQAGMKLGDKPIVMVVRPPLRKHEAYGLAFGLMQPTGQVQFTFDKDEASRACQWAATHAGMGPVGKLIQHDATRYDVVSRGYSHCQ